MPELQVFPFYFPQSRFNYPAKSDLDELNPAYYTTHRIRKKRPVQSKDGQVGFQIEVSDLGVIDRQLAFFFARLYENFV